VTTVAICDYGIGNLRSVERALEAAGARVVISHDTDVLAAGDGLVLPGVGAFSPAAKMLDDSALGHAVRAVAASGRPVLGVCLGHQLLFENSNEGEGAGGLGLLRGSVSRIHPSAGKVPHMGWNRLHIERPSPLLAGVGEGAYVYFVHSYSAEPDDRGDVIASTDHGGTMAAAVQHGNVFGTQFHPEKSGPVGLRIYANFVGLCAVRGSTGGVVGGGVSAAAGPAERHVVANP
jgi:glutamine amidotransferase